MTPTPRNNNPFDGMNAPRTDGSTHTPESNAPAKPFAQGPHGESLEFAYTPPPTNSFMMLTGWNPQPADALYFASPMEAIQLFNDLRRNCPGFPAAAVLRDAPETYPSTLLQGDDGRRVYVIEFILPDRDATGQNITRQYQSHVGFLLQARAQYPNHAWQIRRDESGIVRDPTTPQLDADQAATPRAIK